MLSLQPAPAKMVIFLALFITEAIFSMSSFDGTKTALERTTGCAKCCPLASSFAMSTGISTRTTARCSNAI